MERIESLKQEILKLKQQLQEKENELYDLKQSSIPPSLRENIFDDSQDLLGVQLGSLSKSAISRYSRQILLPEIGVHGQEKLCQAKVLIVGAGGLGCPSAVYLAGAGVGEIGIVDYDTVEISNIHRQILHSEDDEGQKKADSAARSLRSLNSTVKVIPYTVQLDSKNAVEIAGNYDVVLDCSDNVPTRYLLNDLCCYLKIPLISGSALKLEGQLTIYGYKSENNCNEQDTYTGPCYRCVFPLPPHPDTLGSCSANGVAGPIPGVIGCLQAIEAIKYIVGMTRDKLLVGRMLLFDGEDLTFRNVKLRPQNVKCTVCAKSNADYNPILSDYEEFCNSRAKEGDLNLHILSATNRISPKELASKLRKENQNVRQRHLLVDVRSESEYNMCRIDGAVNYPINVLKDKHVEDLKDRIVEKDYEVTFLCRRGNDSQLVAKRILDILDSRHHSKIKDLAGGLHAWSKDVDDNFPIY